MDDARGESRELRTLVALKYLGEGLTWVFAFGCALLFVCLLAIAAAFGARIGWNAAAPEDASPSRSGVVSLRMTPGGTIEAWSASALVWESEPGDEWHATLATIMGEASAIDTRPVQAPQEGPRG